MNIQASRMAASMAYPASAPSRLQDDDAVAGPRAPEVPGAANDATAVTISQAARDRLASEQLAPLRPVLAVGLAPAASSRADSPAPSTQINPISSSSQDYKAAVGKAIDKLEFQRNNQLITDAQFRHDMAFYTRVANAVM